MAARDTRHLVKIEPGLWEWALAHMEANPQKGYSSVTDFVKHVLRLYLEEHGPKFQPDSKHRSQGQRSED